MYHSESSVSSSSMLDYKLFGRWVTQRHYIWQMKFLNADKLAEFCLKHGLSFFENIDIPHLWQLGLLRADMIICPRKIQYPDLIEMVTSENGEFIYSDERQIPSSRVNWEDTVRDLEPLASDIKLFFHPFRFYVLAQLESTLSRNRIVEKVPFPLQSYSVPNFSFFQRWTSSDSFKEVIRTWNGAASLAIMAEPCFYSDIFQTLSVRLPLDFEILRSRISEHWQDVLQYYKSLGIELLTELHSAICRAIKRLDPNADVHMILRLASRDLRLELEGRLGGAMHLHCMAEIIRRATERALEAKLPEEDERGFGEYLKDVKKKLYGSNRLLDGNRLVANEFLKQFGLVYNLRLRWYVEGDTEWGALYSYFKKLEATDIEIINLRAHVAQKAGKGLTFRDSLRSDIRMHIFSFVLIDGDRTDFTTAVRKAAEDDEICGAFFISHKDFEFENFELPELEDILWTIAVENSQGKVSKEDRQKLHDAINIAGNGTELIKRANGVLPELARLKKDSGWGDHLLRYALKNPLKRGKERQIVEAINYAFILARTPNLESYELSRECFQVDRNTGRLVPRSILSS